MRSAREKSLEILRRGWELNPGHGEDTAQLLKIHLSFLVKSSRILEGWHVNKWLRLTVPQPSQQETTSVLSHNTMKGYAGHKKSQKYLINNNN